jgi:hypothetical protein
VADQDRRWQETAIERTREWSQRILPPFLYPPPSVVQLSGNGESTRLTQSPLE